MNKILFILICQQQVLCYNTSQLTTEQLMNKYCNHTHSMDYMSQMSDKMETMNESLGSDDKLQKFIQDPSNDKEYVGLLLAMSAPYIFFYILTILTFLVICFVNCCGKKTPAVRPQPKLCLYIQLLFFVCVLFVFSMIGLIAPGNFTNSVMDIQCTLFTSINTFQNGNQQQKWWGVAPISSQMSQISDNLSSFTTTINTKFNNGDADFNTQQTSLITNIDSMSTTFYTDSGQTYWVDTVGNNTGTKYQNNFMMTGVGPNTTDATIANIFYKEMDIRVQIISPILSGIKTSSQDVSNSMASIKPSLDSAFNTLVQFNHNIQTYANNLNDLFEDLVFNEHVHHVTDTTQGFFSLYLIFVMTSLTALILTKYCKNPRATSCANCLFKCTWLFAFLFALIGFLICIFLAPLTQAVKDSCQILNLSLQNQTYFNKTFGNLISEDDQKYMAPCIWTNGDIASVLGVQSNIDQINNITNQFDNLDQISDPNGELQQLLKKPSVGNETLWTFVDSIVNGTNPDLNLNIPTQDIFDYYSINNFNNYTDNTTGRFYNTIHDHWTYSAQACPSGYTLFTGSAGNQQTSGNVCIPVNTFDPSWLSARYVPGGDNNKQFALSMMQLYLPRLRTYKTARDASYTTLCTSSNVIATDLKSLNDRLTTVVNNMVALKSTVIDTINLISGQNGLVTGINCKFVANSFQTFYNSFCKQFVQINYLIYVFMAGSAFCLYFVMIFDFEVSKEIQIMNEYIKKHGDIEPNNKVYSVPGFIELSKNQEPLFNNNSPHQPGVKQNLIIDQNQQYTKIQIT